MSAAFRKLAALFFCYHVLAIAAVNFPEGNVLHDLLLRPFAKYLELTGQLQAWDMFDSKPDDQRFEVAAFVVDSANRETTVGPIVPGLKPFTPSLKLTTFFYRVHPGSPWSDPFWRRYTQRLCRAVRLARGPEPVVLWVDFVSHRLRTLEQIRADGVLSEKTVATRGPVPCDH